LGEKMGRRRFFMALGGLAVAVATTVGIYKYWSKPKPPEPEPQPPRVLKSNPYVDGDGKSLVSVVKGTSTTDIEALVREAVDSIGGMGKVVSAGSTVVVKPCVATDAINRAPDPGVVVAVVKLAREAGAGSVIVAESSDRGAGLRDTLQGAGIRAAAEAAGAQVKNLDTEQGQKVLMSVPNGVALKKVETFPTIYNCDVLISVPRLKRHGEITLVTISLKNMMGTVTDAEKGRFHDSNRLSECIADLNTVNRPDLTVVDATWAMTERGPGNGTMVEMDTIFASGDPVAVDRVAAQRLQELEESRNIPEVRRFRVEDVEHIRAAAMLGVGTDDLARIKLIEETMS